VEATPLIASGPNPSRRLLRSRFRNNLFGQAAPENINQASVAFFKPSGERGNLEARPTSQGVEFR
jgi:hypothetical protein